MEASNSTDATPEELYSATIALKDPIEELTTQMQEFSTQMGEVADRMDAITAATTQSGTPRVAAPSSETPAPIAHGAD